MSISFDRNHRLRVRSLRDRRAELVSRQMRFVDSILPRLRGLVVAMIGAPVRLKHRERLEPV